MKNKRGCSELLLRTASSSLIKTRIDLICIYIEETMLKLMFVKFIL